MVAARSEHRSSGRDADEKLHGASTPEENPWTHRDVCVHEFRNLATTIGVDRNPSTVPVREGDLTFAMYHHGRLGSLIRLAKEDFHSVRLTGSKCNPETCPKLQGKPIVDALVRPLKVGPGMVLLAKKANGSRRVEICWHRALGVVAGDSAASGLEGAPGFESKRLNNPPGPEHVCRATLDVLGRVTSLTWSPFAESDYATRYGISRASHYEIIGCNCSLATAERLIAFRSDILQTAEKHSTRANDSGRPKSEASRASYSAAVQRDVAAMGGIPEETQPSPFAHAGRNAHPADQEAGAQDSKQEQALIAEIKKLLKSNAWRRMESFNDLLHDWHTEITAYQLMEHDGTKKLAARARAREKKLAKRFWAAARKAEPLLQAVESVAPRVVTLQRQDVELGGQRVPEKLEHKFHDVWATLNYQIALVGDSKRRSRRRL